MKLAMITARGGSKRIPRKNILPFAGKPMLAYAIEAAQQSGLFDEVMVSTDDDEIAAIAREYGAAVPFMRSAKTSDDFSTTADVVEEVLDNYEAQGNAVDTFCCIYPCVPFLTAETLRASHAAFEGTPALMPVCRYSAPIERALRIQPDGQLVASNPELRNMRSQDIEPSYFDVGMFYWARTANFRQHRSLIPPHTCAYIIDEKQCQDIDTPEDWQLAEIKYKLLHP